jgi:hypothetical protein
LQPVLICVGETTAKHAFILGQTSTPPPTPALGQTAEERDAIAAAAIASPTGARQVKTFSAGYPLTSDDDQIDIAGFTGVLSDGSTVVFPAGSVGGLLSGAKFGVFYNPGTATYSVEEEPATASMADSDLAFIGWQATSDLGEYPAPDEPPAGYGGQGGIYQPTRYSGEIYDGGGATP